MTLVTMTLKQVKATKNMVRYDYPGKDKHTVAISAVYISKRHLPNPYPDAVELTLKT